MKIDRRKFIKAGGAATLVMSALPVAQALAEKVHGREQVGEVKWAMAIDVRACWEHQRAGCRRCIDACHHEYNVPDMGATKDEIKWIWSAPFTEVFPEYHGLVEEDLRGSAALALCNHCENAPCVRVCPTKATFQSKTGITIMDYHRCIGCRYCMAACPYGARSFNFRDPRPFIKEVNPSFPTREKGVVEKCNFCAERLVDGLKPLCVEVCPHKALYFGNLKDPESEIRKVLKERFSLQRKAELGTEPKVYYLI
jgi:Fe-S-cluster-containing dehydrogenase component